MSRVVHADHDAYSTVPSWTLTLDCGHIVNFKTTRGDTQTRPPKDFSCGLCAAKNETNQTKGEIMSSKTKAEVGTVAIFDCAAHVCVEVTDSSSTWFNKLATVVAAPERACGYRSLGKQVVEKRNVAEVLTLAAGSHEQFKPMTERQVKDFLAANAVDASEAVDTAETNETKENDMATKKLTAEQKAANKEAKAAKKAPKAQKAAKVKTEKSSAENPKKLMGFSVCTVLNRLGEEGVTIAHAKAIMEKQGKDVSDATVGNCIRQGKAKHANSNPAALTKEQVKELVTSAAAPAEEKAEK